MALAFITASSTSWFITTDGSDITVECIGPGGNGQSSAGAGGGGGAYAVDTVSYVSGTLYNVAVPAGGTGAVTAFNYTSTPTDGQVVADHGNISGGSTTNCVPTAGARNGGSGNNGSGGAGGGAGGPNGDGTAAGTQNGGNAEFGGAADNDNAAAGAGGAPGNGVSTPGNPGGNGTEWDASHGCGGGGGRAPGGVVAGGNGGTYGGGGGSSSVGAGGTGGQGLIVVTYTSAPLTNSIALGNETGFTDKAILDPGVGSLSAEGRMGLAVSLASLVDESISLGVGANFIAHSREHETIGLSESLGITASLNITPLPGRRINPLSLPYVKLPEPRQRRM